MSEQHQAIKDRLLKLALKGQRDEAARLLTDEMRRVTDAILVLHEEYDKLREYAADLGMEGEPSLEQVDVAGDEPMTDSQKAARRHEVLRIATDLATETGEAVSVYDVVRRAVSAGINFGVQPNRRETTVSNILMRSANFDKIGKGLYELRP